MDGIEGTNETVALMREQVARMVWSGVTIEGISSTFVDTQQVIERGYSEGLRQVDIRAINNLKHAWDFLSASYEVPLSFSVYSAYNSIVGEAIVALPGVPRQPGEVMVSLGNGESWDPPADTGEREFDRILSTAGETAYDIEDTATMSFLLLCRQQFWSDGNKRTALLAANHILAHDDAKVAFMIGEENRDAVLDELSRFYVGEVSLEDATWDLEDICVRPLGEEGHVRRDR
jgi:hypothetical protein